MKITSVRSHQLPGGGADISKFEALEFIGNGVIKATEVTSKGKRIGVLIKDWQTARFEEDAPIIQQPPAQPQRSK